MNNYYIIIISLLLSAFFSGMEIAFYSSNKLRFRLEKKQNNIIDNIIEIFYKYSSHYTSTMLIGNSISLVIFSITLANVLSNIVHSNINNTTICAIILILTTTVIIIFTGELIPRTIFKSNPNSLLKIFSPITLSFFILLLPITILTSRLSSYLLKVFKVPTKTKAELEKENFNNLINKTIENQCTSAEEIDNDVKIFHNALEFSTVKVRDCIVPRTEIVALPENKTTLEELTILFTKTGISKLLIYKESTDNIIGYIHCSDLFKIKTEWRNYIREIQVVPETMAASKLMKSFLHEKKSISVVVDEFGGTVGIVTLEDIIEEIFGEIEDEHDTRKHYAKQISENEFIFEGRLEIDYINENFNLSLPESDEYVTIAGYILHYYQNFPKLNETINIGKYSFKVIEAYNNKISTVSLTLRNKLQDPYTLDF